MSGWPAAVLWEGILGFHDYLLSVLRRAGLNMMLEIPQFKQNEGSGLVCNMFVTNLLVLLWALPASPCAPPVRPPVLRTARCGPSPDTKALCLLHEQPPDNVSAGGWIFWLEQKKVSTWGEMENSDVNRGLCVMLLTCLPQWQQLRSSLVSAPC